MLEKENKNGTGLLYPHVIPTSGCNSSLTIHLKTGKNQLFLRTFY